MNAQNCKEKGVKYTSVNLKQKRREIREHRAMSAGRGRSAEGSFNEFQRKKTHYNRINSTKREQFDSAKALSHDSNFSLASSSTRRSKSNSHTSTDSSWQKEHRRSRKRTNCNSSSNNIFSSQAALHRNEPYVRLSVRGTRIFGRRKSYRACPTPKGDARSNGSVIKCRSSSLPCELSQVESHDYEFWNSGFVQSRVRKLEEELTSKCDDRYSFSNDYEVQSLCSLRLDKILPDGDDYRIAYLSSTSQESSLDYMDDNYCTIGMGTLDVKLNKKSALTENEDWDLTFSSSEENETSSDDDDGFFYRRYPNVNNDSSISTPNYYSRHAGIAHGSGKFSEASDHGKKHSNIPSTSTNRLCNLESVTKQIHENVDRIFYNVMNLDLDVPHSVKQKQNNGITVECFSYSSNDENQCNWSQEEKEEEAKRNSAGNCISTCTVNECGMINSKEKAEQEGKMLHFYHNNMLHDSPENNLLVQKSNNQSADDISTHGVEIRKLKQLENSAPDKFSDILHTNMNATDKFQNENFTKNLFDGEIFNVLPEQNSQCQNLQSVFSDRKDIDHISECELPDNDRESEQMTKAPTINISRLGELLPVYDSENKMYKTSVAVSRLPDCDKGESSKLYSFDNPSNCAEYLLLPPNIFLETDISSKIQNIDKFSDTNTNNPKRQKFRNSKRSKYKMKRGRWAEEDITLTQTKSLFEVELIVYEPLCTPFSEIYFITYGEKYPSKPCFKLSIPRKILRDVENEFMIWKFINQDTMPSKQLYSSKVVCQASHRNRAISLPYENNACRDTEKQNSVYNVCGSFTILPQTTNTTTKPEGCILLDLEEKRLILKSTPRYSNEKSIKNSLKPFVSNFISMPLRIEKVLFRDVILKNVNIIMSLSNDFSENVTRVFQNNSHFGECVTLDEVRPISRVSASLCDFNYLKLFLSNIFERKSPSQPTILNCQTTNGCFLSRPESIFNLVRIIDEMKLSICKKYEIVINMSDFPNLSSSYTNEVVKKKYAIEFSDFKFPPKSDSSNKSCVLKRINDKSIVLGVGEHNIQTGINHNISPYCDSTPEKHLFKSARSKRKQEKHSAETNHKISKNNYRSAKNKKHELSNKKWDILFDNYFSKNNLCESLNFPSNSVPEQKNEKILNLSGQNKFSTPEHHQQMKRNRNYGISYYAKKENENTNEVPHAGGGETSESRFAAESQPEPTTSPTGNATFAEYLFPPQLASVRDTTKAHLSISAIRDFQSVPAVQRLLVKRESRFALSGKDHKHGSLCTASANEAASITGIDCFSGVQDLCASEHLAEEYPVIFNSVQTERITSVDNDFVDYLCSGNVPKGLQQVICNRTSESDINLDNFTTASVPPSDLFQNMASCDESPRSINKPLRTPGKNISKLRKLFDPHSSDDVSSDSNISCSKNNGNSASSHSVNVNKASKCPPSGENKPEILDPIINGQCSSLNNNKVSLSEETGQNTGVSQQRISSDVPYCRKVSTSGDLWKNVDTGVNSSNGVLWDNAQTDDNTHTDLRQSSNSFVSSTADLHNLIASSRAELSKKKEPVLSDKSTLENYFTSFESSKPNKCVPLNSTEQSILVDNSLDFPLSENEIFKTTVVYDCDADEMNFDEEDATLSDTSSDEEIRCNPPINNTHYLPAYCLHTIIEESCEESERDSRGPTPTNEPVTSKLERYFSWDIINDNETNVKRNNDDDSTVFSDSLSEASESLTGEASKEIDPSHLASSRLEKYFTSGLVGNENYFYPDDAEFLEDAPVSDFEEDSIHQKISRSALLSSLETLTEQRTVESQELSEVSEESVSIPNNLIENDRIVNESTPVATTVNLETSDEVEDCQIQDLKVDNLNSPEETDDFDVENKCEIKIESDEIQTQIINDTSLDKASSDVSSNDVDNLRHSKVESVESEIIVNPVCVNNDDLSQKQTVSKEQLAVDVQAIIKKLLIYFSGMESKSFNHNMETDYISAWQILETEIERLIQSISPTLSLENNSCNSSTIDSNNSDYGSDTIESLECITDEEETSDSKSRGNVKYPIVDLFNAAYKIQPGADLHNFNISDETLSIWKRLIQSLQRDSFCMNDNKLYDPNTEARLYIRDQIVNLMHTVTVSESKVNEIDHQSVLNIPDKEIASSLIEESDSSDDINEAFNVSVNSSGVLTYSDEKCLTLRKEASDDTTSSKSSENVKTGNILVDESKSSGSDADVECSSDPSTDFRSSRYSVDEKDTLLNADISQSESSVDDKDVPDRMYHSQISVDDKDAITTNPSPEKISVDEVDLKFNSSCRKSSDKSSNFSMCVDIDLGDQVSDEAEQKCEMSLLGASSETSDVSKRSSVHLWVSGDSENTEIKTSSDQSYSTSDKDDLLYVPDDLSNLPPPTEIPCASNAKILDKSYRDTGYYSFKSSDDSMLNDTPPPDEFMDVPNFKSLKRTVKKFPLSSTLSKSTTNINQGLSLPDTKFNTLQLKSHKSKGSSNSANSSSRQFSMFSPSAVFKKLTGSKGE